MIDDDVYRLIFNIILGPTVTILGLIGNSLCILAIVYRNHGLKGKQQFRGMRGYMYTYMTSLAFADICYLLLVGGNYYLTASKEIQEQNENLRSYVIIPCSNAFKATSDFIVILMTYDRYRKMSDIAAVRLQSLRQNAAEENGKHWKIFIHSCGVLALSFVLYAPCFFPYHKNNDNQFQDLDLIFQVISIALTRVTPMFFIVGLNIVIVKRLRVVRAKRKRLTEVNNIETGRQNWAVTSKKSIHEQKLAVLLVVIACSFVLLTLPANIAYIVFRHIFKEDINEGNIEYNDWIPLFAITNFLESVNYSINFYIYCAVHDDIRQSFVDLVKYTMNMFSTD